MPTSLQTRTFAMMHEVKPGWKKRALNELRKLSITVIYLWILLSVFTLHREIILASYHINYSAKFGFAFINAGSWLNSCGWEKSCMSKRRLPGKPCCIR